MAFGASPCADFGSRMAVRAHPCRASTLTHMSTMPIGNLSCRGINALLHDAWIADVVALADCRRPSSHLMVTRMYFVSTSRRAGKPPIAPSALIAAMKSMACAMPLQYRPMAMLIRALMEFAPLLLERRSVASRLHRAPYRLRRQRHSRTSA